MLLSKQMALHIGAAFLATGFMTWLQLRPYGIVFILLLTIWIYRARCPGVRLVIPPAITDQLEATYKSFVKLRQDKPGAFCTIISIALMILAILGHIISGTWIVLIGLMIAGVISTRHKLEIIHEVLKDEKSGWSSQTTDHDVDEFLPDVNESNLFVLQRAGEEAVLSINQPQHANTASSYDDDDTNKSDSENLIEQFVPTDSIPEIGENSDSDTDDEDKNVGLSTKAIEFKTGYFNKDSSSSDEDSITKGLSFQNYSLIDGPESLLDNKKINKNLIQEQQDNSSALPGLVSGIMPWGLVGNLLKTAVIATTAGSSTSHEMNNSQSDKRGPTSSSGNNRQTNPDSSDESEFEILNSDELNNAS